MGRKDRRNRKTAKGHNRHHLIFPRANYSKGCAKMLRDSFVYEMDEEIHRELHKALEGVPKPSDAVIHKIWLKYQADAKTIALMTPRQACEWLMSACDDYGWQRAMWIQIQYLSRGG